MPVFVFVLHNHDCELLEPVADESPTATPLTSPPPALAVESPAPFAAALFWVFVRKSPLAKSVVVPNPFPPPLVLTAEEIGLEIASALLFPSLAANVLPSATPKIELEKVLVSAVLEPLPWFDISPATPPRVAPAPKPPPLEVASASEVNPDVEVDTEAEPPPPELDTTIPPPATEPLLLPPPDPVAVPELELNLLVCSMGTTAP